MPKSGDKPGEGGYICLKCGETVILEKDDDALPDCPKCGGNDYS